MVHCPAGETGDGRGGRTAMLAVMAVDVDGTGCGANELSECLPGFQRDAIVANRDVDVSQALPMGGVELGFGPVDTHHRADS